MANEGHLIGLHFPLPYELKVNGINTYVLTLSGMQVVYPYPI